MGMIRRRWRSLLVIVLAVVAMLGLTLGRGAAFAATTPRLTSAEIVDGLLFDEGRAARYLSSIDRDGIQWTEELRSVQVGIRPVLAADPTGYYGSAFAQAMQSGDPRAVEKALGRLGETVYTYLAQRYGQGQLDDALRAIGAGPSLRPPVIETELVTVNVAATVSVVAVAVVLITLIVIVVVIPLQGGSTEDRLDAEKMINDIAVGLRLSR